MSFIRVYIHFVWSTKSRVPHLATPELRKNMWKHMRENAKKKGIIIEFINGHHDHCHCLVSMNEEQRLRDIMFLIKGESSYWINKQQVLKEKFEWQDEYFAVSVSESMVNKVREYIKNQEIHHSRQTWHQESKELMEKYGFQKYD